MGGLKEQKSLAEIPQVNFLETGFTLFFRLGVRRPCKETFNLYLCLNHYREAAVILEKSFPSLKHWFHPFERVLEFLRWTGFFYRTSAAALING